MAKSKLDFIRDLLVNHKIPDSEKERFFRLASKELKQYDDQVWEELQGLKKQVDNIKNSKINHKGGKKEKQKFPIVHNPQRVVNILDKFTSEKPLKGTTHPWTIGQEFPDYNSFMNDVKGSYNEIKPYLKQDAEKLYAKINNFLINPNLGKVKKNKRGEDYEVTWNGVKIGWSSPDLAKWCEKYPHKSPWDFHIPQHLNDARGETLREFRDAVDIFKREIQFRREGDHLKNAIQEIVEKRKIHFDYDGHLNNLEGKKFFTDVQWVRDVIGRIFDQIRYHSKNGSKKYVVDFISNKHKPYHILKIIHVDSFSKEITYDNDDFTNPAGDLNAIIDNLKNLADLSVISRFKDKEIVKLNYLVSKEKKFVDRSLDSCEGFTYELKFYKASRQNEKSSIN